jgi:hypothetical protein
VKAFGAVHVRAALAELADCPKNLVEGSGSGPKPADSEGSALGSE